MAQHEYRVTTVPVEPFVMSDGKGGYKGYIVDILDRVSEHAGFTYAISPCKDGQYGSLSTTGLWTGMIGELVRNETDIAAGALTITANREKVIDFTRPYLTQSIRLLITKPARASPSLFRLLQPFSAELWTCILIALVVVALLFIVISRFNPYEWRQVAPEKDPRGARHSFGPRGSFMFVFGTITLQGFRETPRSLSGRTLAVFWFIFVFFVIVTYIANLVAFMWVPSQMMQLPSSIDEIIKGSRPRILALRNGSTYFRFKNSAVEFHQQLARYLETNDYFVNTTEEGLERMRRHSGDWALLVESSKAEYETQQAPCNLMLIGPEHFVHGLGLATRKRSKLRALLDSALLSMQEDGTLQMLRNKWFYTMGQCPLADSKGKGTRGSNYSVTSLTLAHLKTPFLILITGVILSVLVLIAEVLFKKFRS